MSNTLERKDGWKPSEDKLLANVIIEHVRQGSTQLKAFEEAAEHLNRTAAACGFRWNSEIRKQYEHELKNAKLYRSSRKIHNKKQVHVVGVKNNETHEFPAVKPLDSLMDQLLRFKMTVENMEKQIRELTNEVREKNSIIESLTNQIEKGKTPQEKMTEDYKNLIQIINRARELGLMDRIS
ncbi:sporulation specific transcriptional regulator GerR [Paenibacillus vulneris]|uniref:Myb-like domain-containing protein n=1 Tax=Paenibacillus vulneris TaxID=1133364 RepID=A0ABW3UIC2_9BACL